MKPTKPQMQQWFRDLKAGERATMGQAELTFARAARPLLESAGLIDNTTTDEDIVEALRMRF
jgi:hypothetical protein